MKNFWISTCLAVFSALSGASSAEVTDQNFEVSQDGLESKIYQVALDEIYCPGEGLRKVPAQTTVKNLQTLTIDLILATKEAVFLVIYPPGEKHTAENRRIITDEIVVQASRSAAASLSKQSGVFSVTPIGFAPGYYKLTVTNPTETLSTAKKLEALPGVTSAEPQIAKEMQKRAAPNDPLFPQQWHLKNTGQNGGTPGVDLNIVNVWDDYQGNGQVIGIVDDGLQKTHEDLASAYISALSYDFNDNDSDPSPILADEDFHGTACAGVAAAAGNNGIGVSGAAPKASLAGLRLLGGPISDMQIASAIDFKNNSIQIKSNSWGPFSGTLEGPGNLSRMAMASAVNSGRAGRGTILLWAGGNDFAAGDDVNYDGYANSIYAFAIGAVNDRGVRASYSEPGACLLVVAPSNSAGRQGITTTDIQGSAGYNSATDPLAGPSDENYTAGFGGTSSATPAVAGIAALMLNAKSTLTWREMKNILIRTARKTDPLDSDWIVNGAGLNFNHKYGAGLVDADAAVAAARSGPRLPTMRTDSFVATGLPIPIPEDSPAGVTITIPVVSGIRSLEHVVLVFSAQHTFRGDLKITLTSPAGTSSSLASVHGDGGDNYTSWPFMTLRNWGENPNGDWVLKVSDEAGIDVGTLSGATLVIYGTASTPSNPIVPTGSNNVLVTINSPTNGDESSRGRSKIEGVAASSTGALERVEYRHYTFGTISENSKPESGWTRASGTDNWLINANLVRGENIFHVRAVNSLQEISYVTTVRVLVR